MNVSGKIYILIPVFDGWAQTRNCLQALRASSYQDFCTVIIDHGPGNDNAAWLSAEFPEVTHLRADSELWWAGASNVGIEYALAEGAGLIMLLNNDCYLEPNCLATLVAAAKDLPGAVIAPVQVRNESGAVLSLAPQPLLWLGFTARGGPLTITESMRRQRYLPVELIGGGRGALIPAEVFRTVGLFDSDHLPHYHADHDFYYRCRAAGVRLYVAVAAVVRVDGSSTSVAERPERMTLEQFLGSLRSRRSHRNLVDLGAFYKKHYPLKTFYRLGLWLNFARYLLVYLAKRSAFLLFRS